MSTVGHASRIARGLGTLLGAAITIAAIVWGLDLPPRFGWLIYTEQFLAAMLGAALAIAYLRARAADLRDAPNFIFALFALIAGVWLTLRYPVLQADMITNLSEGLTLAILLLVLVIDCCRRTAGFPLVLVFAFFFVYAMVGHLLPGLLETKSVSLKRLLPYLTLDTSSMLGPALIIACTTVVAFMFFGRLLQVCGGGEFFTDVSSALLGRYRGGTGKVEVVASALFGTISGSAVANVMSTGIITIPNMKRAGYLPHTAGAVEAVSSTGGQIMPPVMGAAAFLMAENLQMRYAEIALAALVPAALFYLAVFVQVDFEAAKRKIGGIDPALLPKPRDVLRAGWYFIIPFAMLIWLMFSRNWEAEPAVLAGAAAMVPFAWLWGYGGKKLRLRGIWEAIVETGRDAVDLIVICAVAGMVIGLLNITGLALGLSISLVRVGEESLPLLLVFVAIICIVLGMGLPTTGVYLLVAVLAAPSLVKLGVPPLAAHMFVFFFGCLSMITPPVAMAAYAAAHIAQASPMKVGWAACKLGWPAFALPFLFAWSPTLLLQGEVTAVVMAVVSAAVGTWLGSAAIAGQFFTPLSPLRRCLFGAAAVALLLPGHGFQGAGWVELAGAILAALLIAWDFSRRSAARHA